MKKTFLLVIILGIVTTGCDKDLLDKKPLSTVDAASYYQLESQMVKAVNAAYVPLTNLGFYKRQYSAIIESLGDDFVTQGQAGQDWVQLDSYVHGPGNIAIKDLWESIYVGLFFANTVIDKINEPGDYDLKNRVYGEALFLRALYNFHLVTLWGEAPIITFSPGKDKGKNEGVTNPSNGNVEGFYTQIETDLTLAEDLLPSVSELSSEDIGRATSGAAKALLGKAYLYQQKWQQAADKFTEVVTSDEYSLLTNYSDNFVIELNNGAESLFEIQHENNFLNGWLQQDPNGTANLVSFKQAEFGPDQFSDLESLGFNNFSVTQRHVDEYETDDPRLAANILQAGDEFGGDTYSGDVTVSATGYSVRKGIDPAIIDKEGKFEWSSQNQIIIRYADVLLMLAEALNEVGQTAQAATYVNMVRRRADPSENILPDRDEETATQDQMRDWIRHERRVELFFEMHRWFDIVRWGIAEETITGFSEPDIVGKSIDRVFEAGKHEFLPIPAIEIDINPNLEPNTGW